jgi:hypothetical protein
MSLESARDAVVRWYATRPPHTRVLLAAATLVLVVELLFRRFAPGSPAYAAWRRFFEGIGKIWTGVLLGVIYVLSVGLVSVVFRLLGKDPLDRKIGTEASFWKAHEPSPLGTEAAVRHQF